MMRAFWPAMEIADMKRALQYMAVLAAALKGRFVAMTGTKGDPINERLRRYGAPEDPVMARLARYCS